MDPRRAVQRRTTTVACLLVLGWLASASVSGAKLLEDGIQHSWGVNTAGLGGARSLLQSEATINMWFAAYLNDTMAFQQSLFDNPDINYSSGDENACPCTALILAAGQGNLAIVEALIGRKADLEAVTATGGATALFAAAQSGHLAVVDALIEAGADVNKARTNGATPLQVASERGHILVVLSLLDAGADPKQADDAGYTPLHVSSVTIGSASVAIATALLKNGADLEAKDNDGWTPLIWAAHFGNLETMELFLEEGADKTVKDNDGDTPRDHVCRCSFDAQSAGDIVCPSGGCDSPSVIAVMEEALN